MLSLQLSFSLVQIVGFLFNPCIGFKSIVVTAHGCRFALLKKFNAWRLEKTHVVVCADGEFKTESVGDGRFVSTTTSRFYK